MKRLVRSAPMLVILAASGTAALAAGNKPTAVSSQLPVAIQQPAAAPARPQYPFFSGLFASRRSAPAPVDPVSILPPGAPRPQPAAPAAPVDWAGSAFRVPPPAPPVVVVPVPQPRPRPEYHAPAAVADASRVDKQVVNAALAVPAPAPVDPSITGSIPELPGPLQQSTPEPPPRAMATEALAVEAATAVPAPPATDSDTLLGDPGGFVAPESPEREPRFPSPSGFAAPLPRGPGGGAGNTAALPKGEPFELVRRFQSLQDGLAQGSVEAQKGQAALRAAIERAFASAGSEVWRDRRNAMAAVTYVLSGGAPDALRKLAALDSKSAIDSRLVAGVLAYSEGREAEAGELLGPIDPIDLSPSLGAQVAIAQSALVVRADPQKAMRVLAVARLLAPGTLVEEAAIRRQIFIADQLKDDRAVQSLARQYLDRFRNSVYAGNFRDRFATAISHMDFINDAAQFPRLDDMLASAEPAGRLQLYLTVALASALKSRTVATILAAERSLALAAPGSPEESRARLYHAAALAVGAKSFDAAVAEHGRVDRKLLSASDQALLDVVAATIAGVRSATDRPKAPLPPDLAPAGTGDKENPLMKRAADAIKAADTLLTAAR